MLGKRKTGNERWVRNVLVQLRTLTDHDLIAFVADDTTDLPPGVERRVIRPAWPFARQLWSLRRAVRAALVDVLLVQYVAPAHLPCPVVTVVHDVSFVEHPRWFSPLERIWMQRLIPRTMRAAAFVVTVSEFSRDEIARLTETDPSRIVVAPDGVDPVFREPARPPEAEPYFLAVGNITPRKDLPIAIEAHARARGNRPDFPVLLVAGQDTYGASATHAAAKRTGAVRFLGYVDDGALAGLTGHALALLSPSRYEGFGLPALEAMAAGAPVIASDIPVMREVTGEAALLIPVGDAAAWADAILKIHDDVDLRQRMIAAGRARAARFTWERCAEMVLRALEEAAADPREGADGRRPR